jgi:hypothetical protein
MSGTCRLVLSTFCRIIRRHPRTSVRTTLCFAGLMTTTAHDPDDLRREVLYPVLDRCGIKRTPRADGFHAFRRATSKYLRKLSGLELAAVQLGHKRMITTDEHYNDRDLEDLKKAADLVENAFGINFTPNG